MFKINIYLRFGLIAFCLVVGIVLSIAYGFWYAFPLLLTGILLLAGYFLLGTIMSAGELLQMGDFAEAEKRLDLTKFPKLLYKTNRAFYYILKGSLAMNRKDTAEAEEYLKEAQSIELPSDNERAMVELQLANIQAQRSNWNAVKHHINKAKKMNVTESQLKMQIKQFEQGIKQSGGITAARQMNKGRMPTQMSGKRRRPKMK